VVLEEGRVGHLPGGVPVHLASGRGEAIDVGRECDEHGDDLDRQRAAQEARVVGPGVEVDRSVERVSLSDRCELRAGADEHLGVEAELTGQGCFQRRLNLGRRAG